MNAISFEISAHFGFFQWGKTRGDNRISNLFISRTDVLGILGAIIGLEGYGQRIFKEKFNEETSQSFYEALGGLHVSIIPKNKPTYFEDHLIHRYMKHVNGKGSLMVYMKGLVEPRYKIVIERNTVEPEIFDKLVMYLENDWAEFIPYLGKNQFPLEITNVKRETLTKVDTSQKINMDSLYKPEQAESLPKVKSSDIRKGYHYSDSLKNFKTPGSLEICNEQVFWSSIEVEMNDTVYQTNEGEQIIFL